MAAFLEPAHVRVWRPFSFVSVKLKKKNCCNPIWSLIFYLIIFFSSILQLDLTSAQLLVTDNDFRDKEFRSQLSETVKSLLSLRVIPVFNENDAVSTRKAPYEVSFTS